MLFSFGHNTEGKWWWVWWGYTGTLSRTITAGTWYTVSFDFINGSQKMYIDGTEVKSTTYSDKTKGTMPIYLFARNDSTITADKTTWIRSVKIWEDNIIQRHFEVYIAHSNAHGTTGFYESVQKKYYDIPGNFQYMYAKAKKVKKMYIGISNKARKVKKMYVGVNGKAQQVYPNCTLQSFTANPAPTSWSGTTTTADAVFSASNSYGTWSVSSNQAASSTTYLSWKAFDDNTSTYHRTTKTANNIVMTLTLPENISIKPAALLLRIYYCGTGTKVEGRKEGTSTWEQIYATTSGTTSVTSYTPAVSTSNYYDAFRITTTTQSSSYVRRIYEFQVTSGTIKDYR